MITREHRTHDVVRVVVAAPLIGLSLSQILLSFLSIPTAPGDTDAYWHAAMRLRDGEPLYVAATDSLATDIYRYAPWFAWLWVPLTFLPREAVEIGWRVAMVIATGVALIPLLMHRSLAAVTAASVLGWLTVQTALYGNVQPLLIAGLAWTVDRRWGPLWIAVAASMKFVPILYLIVYLGRREWRKAAWALLLTAVLTAPMLLHDLSGYTTTPGVTPSLFSVHPILWVIVTVAVAAIAFGLSIKRSPAAWLGASTAVILGYPQLHLSYASHLLVGTRQTDAPRD